MRLLKPFHHIIVLSLLIPTGTVFSSSLVDTLDDTTAFVKADSGNILLSQLNLPIRFELNKINNNEGLCRLAAKLIDLSDNKRKTVTIVHIGDSHLQAGLFSAPLREWLQRRFGNAGRGLVFPYRVIKTNGPLDYSFGRTGAWIGHNLLRRNPVSDTFFPGISGFVAKSVDSNASLCIRIGNPEDRFNCIQVFAQNSMATGFCGNNEGSSDAVSTNNTTGTFPWLHTISLDSLCDSATIVPSFPRAIKPDFDSAGIAACSQQGGKPAFVTEGMVLLNGQPGVLYHAIGVNGAQVEDFLSARMFWEQLPALQPDLLIVSLGVNNVYEPSFDSELFKQCLDSLRSLISMKLPDCDLLITTLNDHNCRKKHSCTRMITAKNGKKARRTYVQTTFINNPRTLSCNQALLQFCEKHCIAYWDIFEIMGGNGSIAAWVKQKAAASDHLHFTLVGYKILGTLFQKALEPAISP